MSNSTPAAATQAPNATQANSNQEADKQDTNNNNNNNKNAQETQNNKATDQASRGNATANGQAAAKPMDEDAAPKKTQVNETVPNPANMADYGKTPGQPDKVDPALVVEHQHALLQQFNERTKMLEKQLHEMQEESKKKRKRDEEEAQEKRRRLVEMREKDLAPTIRNWFEEMEKNSDGAIDKHTLQEQKQKALEKCKTAEGQQELEGEYGKMLKMAYCASMSAKEKRERDEQRMMRNRYEWTTRMLSQPPTSSIGVSGGFGNNNGFGAANNNNDNNNMSVDDANRDSGVVRASNNASGASFIGSAGSTYGAGSGNAAATTTETVGATNNDKQKQPAAPGVDLNAANWAEQVYEDFVHENSVVPSEAVLRRGGVQVKTRIVNSANGARHEQKVRDYRLQTPRQGRHALTMRELDPEGFKFLVDGIKQAFQPGARVDRNGLHEARRLTELNENNKYKYVMAYKGPIPEDKLISADYTAFQ